MVKLRNDAVHSSPLSFLMVLTISTVVAPLSSAATFTFETNNHSTNNEVMQ